MTPALLILLLHFANNACDCAKNRQLADYENFSERIVLPTGYLSLTATYYPGTDSFIDAQTDTNGLHELDSELSEFVYSVYATISNFGKESKKKPNVAFIGKLNVSPVYDSKLFHIWDKEEKDFRHRSVLLINSDDKGIVSAAELSLYSWAAGFGTKRICQYQEKKFLVIDDSPRCLIWTEDALQSLTKRQRKSATQRSCSLLKLGKQGKLLN